MPSDPTGPLIVLCRPSQLREAAVVLSCCPPGQFCPLIVIERAPLAEAEYRARYAAYVMARDARDALSGTTMARHEATAEALERANAAVDAAAERLTGYRSWWRHQRMVAELLATHPSARAILLFDPGEGDLDQLDAIPMSRIGDARLPLLPKTTEVVRLPADAADEALAAAAWSACGRGGALQDGFGPDGDDPGAWLAALARALREGRPIRPGGLPGPMVGEAETDEAVLIETADTAERLLGVQYAHARGARLVLTPEPPLGDIQDAVAAMQDVADGKLFGALKEYLFGDPVVGAGLKRIVAAVNEVVPDAVVEAVGGRALTAFTAGVPYTFVRRGKANWSGKAIGHVTGDATLLVLTDLLGAPDDDFGFSLIFDPGYFQTDETAEVLAALERLSHPIVLKGASASNLALVRLGAMPLDVVHFNTHGSNREILLADGALPAFKLQQRQRLRSRPFVFNSSCLSWVGVGREFVRVGARGYAGTLWSVNAQFASTYAQTVLDRVTRQGWAIARAMRGTGVDSATELAYVYAGTAASRLARAAPAGDGAHRLARATQVLLYQLCDSLGTAGNGPARLYTGALEDHLWQEAEGLGAERARLQPEPDEAWVETAALRLRVMALWAVRRREVSDSAPDLYRRARAIAEALPLDPPVRDRHLAELTLQIGRFHLARDDHRRAVALLTESVALDGAKPPALLSLCDALRRANRPAEALAAAMRARDASATDDQPDRARLGALGRLAQLRLAAGDAEGALADARAGSALAVALDDLRERTAFKGDEARALLRSKRFAEAEQAGLAFRALAQQSFDDESDLSACGVLVGALTGSNRLAEAERLLDTGLALAQRLGLDRSVGDFLIDRRRLRSAVGDHEGAMCAALEAVGPFVKVGDMARVRNALGQAGDAFNALHKASAGTEWVGALFMKAGLELAVLGHVTSDLQTAIATEAVSKFRWLLALPRDVAIVDGISALADRAEAMLEQAEPVRPPILVLMARAYRAFAFLACGDLASARAPAAEADGLTGGGTGLLHLVDGTETPSGPR